MSKSIFRMALEGETVEMTARPTEPTIVMSGPLSEIFTKALDVAYAKADPLSGTAGIAQESQAQDVTVMQKIVESINNNSQQAVQPVGEVNGELGQPMAAGADLQVYGVAKQDITDSDVVDVADALMNEDEASRPKDFVVVVDSTIPGTNGPGSAPQEEIEYLSEAMESLTKRLGGRFYRSFEEFVDASVSGETNEGADGTGGMGCAVAQQGGEGQEGDPATTPDPKDPSITSRVVEIAKIAREEAAGTAEAAAEAGNGGETPAPPALEAGGAVQLKGDITLNGTLGTTPSTSKPAAPAAKTTAVATEDGTDVGQPVATPVNALPNDPGSLSATAQAAIGAGDKSVPLPVKEGEIAPELTNNGDPTVSLATESYRVRVVTIAPRQRVRARK